RRCVALLQICVAYSDSRILAGALAASLALFSCHSAFVPMRCSGDRTVSQGPWTLDIGTLIGCARTKKQEHLLAISRRKTLPDQTGRRPCRVRRPAGRVEHGKNVDWRFSNKGFNTLLKRAHGDDALTSCVAMRRSKLQVEGEFAKADINSVVSEVTERIQVSAATRSISYAAAQVRVESMHRAAQLTAGKLQEFAAAGRFEEMVAALSVMSNVPTAIIERNRLDSQAEALLVFAEAIGLSWETTRSIMVLAAKRHRRSTASVDQAMPAFHRLRQSAAEQILDFHRMSSRTARSH